MSRTGQVFPQPISVGGRVNAQTANYTILVGDAGKLISFKQSTSLVCTLPTPSTFSTSFYCVIENRGTGSLALTPAGGITLDDSSSALTLTANQGVALYTDGTQWYTERGVGGSGGGGTTPTGTGFRHVTSGVEDPAAVGETGTGLVVRNVSPSITTPTMTNPVVGTQSAGNSSTLAASTQFVGLAITVATSKHDEPLTDGNGNFIFMSGDIIVIVGVPN